MRQNHAPASRSAGHGGAAAAAPASPLCALTATDAAGHMRKFEETGIGNHPHGDRPL